MKKGFTLIELLIVIAIIAILAVVVFVALDPLTRFEKARDAQRWSDVNSVLEAITLNQVDNGGEYFTALQNIGSNTYYMIGDDGLTNCNDCTAVGTDTNCFELTYLKDEGYLPEIPFDPIEVNASEDKTYYYFIKDPDGYLSVGACDPENFSEIKVSR